MTHVPRVAATNSADWLDLVVELDRWEEAGIVARLWWRDDDAVAPTPHLDRLLTAAGGTPLALAVIPADATAELADALAGFPQVNLLHHGWCHANHAPTGKKSEYPAERHPVDVADELDEGRRQMRRLFGPRALPVFVPPWNRFAPRFVPLLAEAGFTALSQMAPRKGGPPDGGPWNIEVIDVHVDIVDWHAGRGFVGEGPVLRNLAAALRRERRAGYGPIGILTHHLLLDDATEAFLGRICELFATHPAACWVDVRELVPRLPVAP